MKVQLARGDLEISRCLVMGIVNRTPDSFFDGGRMDLDQAASHARSLIDQGADLLDLGAMKAGPGADVDSDEELRRLIPLVEALADVRVPLSVETSRPDVARAALRAGAALVNDVTGSTDPDLFRVVAEEEAGLILMHAGGQIRGRPRHPRYTDVVAAVIEGWTRLRSVAANHGVPERSLIVDPGLDFGKNTFHSLELMHRLPDLVGTGWPVLVAASRKDVVGETLALPVEERLEGSLALVSMAVLAGASLVRVHDVRASVRTVRMIEAVEGRVPPAEPIRGLWD